jgi:hypothetical protein
LGILDGAVDILYNTFVVNGDQERVWVGASVIRELAKKFLFPCKPSKERRRFGTFRIRIQILSSRGKESTAFYIRFYIGGFGR